MSSAADDSKPSLTVDNPSKIAIIKPQFTTATAFEDQLKKQSLENKRKVEPLNAGLSQKCSLCCAALGLLSGTIANLTVLGAANTAFLIMSHSKVYWTLQSLGKQMAWVTIPAALSSSTLYFLVSESFWSHRRNSWLDSWLKAFMINSSLWLGAVGLATVGWRVLLPRTSFGRRLCLRYPSSHLPIELRQILADDQFFKGMDAAYWASLAMAGQVGFMAVVGWTAYLDSVGMIASPNGYFMANCVPGNRREHFLGRKKPQVSPDEKKKEE